MFGRESLFEPSLATVTGWGVDPIYIFHTPWKIRAEHKNDEFWVKDVFLSTTGICLFRATVIFGGVCEYEYGIM